MRETLQMVPNANPRVTISRTLIPNLPAEYLSRRHLFTLINNEPSGTTFVIAPGGYGKTTLVSEWAQSQQKPVIWMTVANGDTTNEMSAMLIGATRRVIPNFAPWFERDQPLRATEVVRRWGNDLMQIGKDFIFVLDNLRSPEDEDVDIAVKIIQQFPQNMHFVAIRSAPIEGIYGACSSRGPIKILSINELRFSEVEIKQLAINSKIEITQESLNLLLAGSGWPAATGLLVAHLQANGNKGEIENILASSVEPLRALAMLVLNGLDEEVSTMCEKLSVLELFTLEDAKLILGQGFSHELIDRVAHKGEIFAPLRGSGVGFAFSRLVRQVFLERLQTRGDLARQIHESLIVHFEKQGNPSAAIGHAFLAGNQEKISELFPSAARVKQVQGRGGELLRWSVFAANSAVDGDLKRATVAITGHLADLDFLSAESEISRLNLLAENSEIPEFFRQFSAGASMYCALTLGKFDLVEDLFLHTQTGLPECLLGVDDQINLLRLLTVKRYIWNEADGVKEAFLLSQELGKKTALYTSHIFLHTIHAMHLHQRGEYRRAYEMANLAHDQISRNGFVGNHGPLDVMYVMARCLLEFARPQDALEKFENIREMAYQWKQWHWYFAADAHVIEFMTFSGMAKVALERVQVARDFASSIDSPHELQAFCDLAEMNTRRNLKDFDRLEILVNRAPNIRLTRQMRMAVDEFRGRKNIYDDAKDLPGETPRDSIWKHLTSASLHIDKENIALASMKMALQVGAEVGAKETFLRQRNEMGNLIIRIANEFPTVYNEDIASAMAERIMERGANVNAGQPSLTKRELEILRQLTTGRTLTVISGELHISQNTMKTHLKNLYKKIGAESRHDAIEKAKALFLI